MKKFAMILPLNYIISTQRIPMSYKKTAPGGSLVSRTALLIPLHIRNNLEKLCLWHTNVGMFLVIQN